jgi:hypothetical protein
MKTDPVEIESLCFLLLKAVTQTFVALKNQDNTSENSSSLSRQSPLGKKPRLSFGDP